MIFVLFSCDPDVESVCRIKIPTRGVEDQPYAGFLSRAIGEAFLKVKGLPIDSLSLKPLAEVRNMVKHPFDILVFRTIEQIQKSVEDPDGNDYERLVERHDV